MKKLIYITIAILSVWSCARFDDSKIWEEFENYYERLEKLEAACDVMNSNISALQAIVTALQGNDYVTSVAEIVEDGKVVGYTITFSKSGVVKICHGVDGADGENGVPGADGRPGIDGTDGENGSDGVDGHSPVVGVRKDADGVYYWTIDGEWMLDDKGQKVPASGKNGADAENGASGKDGITPLLKIEDGYWFVSYDGGKSWTKLYKAVGENGADGADGAPGQDGEDGKDGKDSDSFFQSVDTSSSEDYIILTLSDGTQIKLPTWKAFEELQTVVNKLNTNLSALQAIVEALQNNEYITEITPTVESGVEVGYTISFSSGKSIIVYHGKDGTDGKDGADGAPGQDGEDGKDGKDGYSPILGIKQAEDDWTLDNGWNGDSSSQTNYYWTLDGEWLLDENGNRIPASATNSIDGTNGSTGQNGITPKLKITDGYWYVSLDGGQTWQPEPLGPATAGAGGSIFSDISYDNAYLYITLTNGELIRILRYKEDIKDYCQIDSVDVKGRNVSITGHLNIYQNDIAYTQLTLYYSNEYTPIEFNIYNAKRVTISTFDYNQNFSIDLKSLEYETRYCYCVGVKVRGDETYSPIYEFTTGDKSEDVFNFAGTKWLSYKYIKDETGKIVGGTANYVACEDYIPISGNTRYNMTLGGVVMRMRYFAWYDIEKNFISGTRDATTIMQAPEGAAYLRVTLSAGCGWFTPGEQTVDSEGHLTNPDATKINLIALPDDDSDNPKGKYLFYEDHSDLIFNSFLGSQYFYFSGASIVSSLNEKTVNGAWCMLSKECAGSCTITAYLVDLSNSTPPNWKEIGSTKISNLPAGTHIEFDIPETIVPENHTIGFRASKAIIATVIGRDSTIAKQETSYYDTAESTTPKKLTTASYDIRLK